MSILKSILIILILASNLTISSGGSSESKALDTDEPTDLPISAPATTDDSATIDGSTEGN